MNARPDTISETMIVPQINPFAFWITVYHVASCTNVGYISVTLSTVICNTSANFCNNGSIIIPLRSCVLQICIGAWGVAPMKYLRQ